MSGVESLRGSRNPLSCPCGRPDHSAVAPMTASAQAPEVRSLWMTVPPTTCDGTNAAPNGRKVPPHV